MHTHTKKPKFKTLLLAATISQIYAVNAQESKAETSANESDHGIEKIIVTSERRAQSLQDVPVAVTALSSKQLHDNGTFDLDSISNQTPSFTMTEYGVGEPQLFIRGIGSTIDSIGADSSVAVFIDEVYVGRSAGATSEIFDLERVEVLRGPQGTLYGKNVVGGAINIISKKPTEDFDISLEGTLGTYGQQDIRAAVRGSLAENVFGSLSLSTRNRDGFSKNLTTGGDMDDLHNHSARGMLRILPNDDMELTISADYMVGRANGNARHMDPIGGPFAPLFSSIVSPNPRERRHAVDAGDGNQDRDIWGISANFAWQLDDVTFNSITAYRDTAYSVFVDVTGAEFIAGDFTSFPLRFNQIVDQSAAQFSQEFRLSGETDTLNWVTGLYYLREDGKRIETSDQTFQPPLAPVPAALLRVTTHDQANVTDSYAVFGQVTYAINDDLNLTGGLRWSKDEKVFTNDATRTGAFGLAAFPFSVAESKSWDAFTPRLSLDYRLSQDLMFYGTYSKGFKSGGWDGQPVTVEAARESFDPEYANNFEIGTKTQWFNNRLRLNVSTYMIDYTDLQVQQLLDLDNDITTPPVKVISNAGAVESKGVEVEIQASLSSAWRLNTNYSYLDSRVSDDLFEAGINLKGNRTTHSPRHSLSIGTSYTFELGDNGSTTLRANWSFQDETYFLLTNTPETLRDDFALLDLSASWLSADQTWEVKAWMKNVKDELYWGHSIPLVGSGFSTYGAPRTAGLTVTWYPL